MPRHLILPSDVRSFGAACALLAGLSFAPLALGQTADTAPQTPTPSATGLTQPPASADTNPQQADATTPEARQALAAQATDEANDPLEGFNRQMFAVNEALDTYMLRPAAEAYHWALPDFLQTGIRNVLWNLRSPVTLANDLLQGDFSGAGVTIGRFVINSTLGVGGLIDVAKDNGLPYRYESLDQTFAVWGIPEGFYLVVPFLGPTTLRDVTGYGLEAWADPVSRYLDNTHNDWAMYTRGGVTVLDTRAQYLDVLDDLKRNSVDYYAAMRSLYRQREKNMVNNGKPDPSQYPDIPDYDDAKGAKTGK